jgi:F-type H+-transporting ATPase subunit b
MPIVMMFAPETVANYLSTGLFTIINLLVSYYILKRFLFKPILKMLRKRQTEVASVLQDADNRLKDAESKLATADIRLEESSQEASELISSARSQAEVQSESILSEARRESTARLARADGEISRMRAAMINNIRDEVADLSVAIASKVVGQAIDEHRQRELVDYYLNDELARVQSKYAGDPSPAPAANEVSGNA